MHAGFGKHWLKEILVLGDRPHLTPEAVHARCSQLVNSLVATATPDEVDDLKRRSQDLLSKASRGLPPGKPS
jgi:hypothetical protein